MTVDLKRDDVVDTEKDDAVKDLIAHLTWCLDQYESPTGGSEPQSSVSWSPLKTLQNHLVHFCGNLDSGKTAGVAEILFFVLDRVFSDLGTDTPWDEQGLIKTAWGKTQVEVLELLQNFKDALESPNGESRLWQSFQDYIQAYNKILAEVNLSDFTSVKESHVESL